MKSQSRSSTAAQQQLFSPESSAWPTHSRAHYSSRGKWLGIAGLVAASMLLAGCPQNAKQAVESIPIGFHTHCDVWPYGDVRNCHTGFGVGTPPGGTGGIGNWGSLTAGDIYIDTVGTTTPLPPNGTGTLSVYDGSGQLVGAASFAWTRTGTKIKLQNPSAVQTWIEGYANTGASIKYELAPIAVPLDGQFVTVTNTLIINHEFVASASDSFIAKDPGHSNQVPHL